MARVRAAARRAVSGVPEPLRDRHAAFWNDPGAVEDLAAAYGLRLTFQRQGAITKIPAWSRFDTFRRAYLEDVGLTHSTWPRLPDYARALEAGIDMRSSSRERLGVRI